MNESTPTDSHGMTSYFSDENDPMSSNVSNDGNRRKITDYIDNSGSASNSEVRENSITSTPTTSTNRNQTNTTKRKQNDQSKKPVEQSKNGQASKAVQKLFEKQLISDKLKRAKVQKTFDDSASTTCNIFGKECIICLNSFPQNELIQHNSCKNVTCLPCFNRSIEYYAKVPSVSNAFQARESNKINILRKYQTRDHTKGFLTASSALICSFSNFSAHII